MSGVLAATAVAEDDVALSSNRGNHDTTQPRQLTPRPPVVASNDAGRPTTPPMTMYLTQRAATIPKVVQDELDGRILAATGM